VAKYLSKRCSISVIVSTFLKQRIATSPLHEQAKTHTLEENEARMRVGDILMVVIAIQCTG
jgi:hypothetical protein